MKSSVVIVDYGVGNILSVCRAFEACGSKVDLTDNPGRILAAERVVLPGVGAFGDCMAELKRRFLIAPILDFVATGKPLLGICVGMQMLMDVSEEFGEHRGLGIIAGRVRAIPPTATDGTRHKIPHIGWSSLIKPTGVDWTGTIFEGINPGSSCYFVHSFACEPNEEKYLLADCDYNGRRIAAALQIGNVYGTQFHPEKSGERGLSIIRNFLALKHSVVPAKVMVT